MEFLLFVPLLMLVVVVFLLGAGVLLIFLIYSSRRAREKSVLVESALQSLRNQIVVVTGSTVPGSQITRIIGLVRGVSDTQASSKEEFALAEKEALFNMLSEARKVGASAVIEARLSTGTYQQQGSKWQVSQAVYSGTAVEIAPPHHQPAIPADAPAHDL
jgi:uncharacterized protein YbjQ (UPF0145 family)